MKHTRIHTLSAPLAVVAGSTGVSLGQRLRPLLARLHVDVELGGPQGGLATAWLQAMAIREQRRHLRALRLASSARSHHLRGQVDFESPHVRGDDSRLAEQVEKLETKRAENKHMVNAESSK